MKNAQLSFASDNHAPVAPRIMSAIIEANQGSAAAYGTDPQTRDAQRLFKKCFGQNATAHWVFNGTAANVLAIKVLLRPWEAVICAKSSHLNLDECAAPEALGGFKLICIDCPDGKIRPEQIVSELIRKGDQHFAQPKVVSITQPTEWGTVYSIKELEALREVCTEHSLLLHIDGARFSIAAASLNVSFEAIACASGAASISFGGTKNGLMGGEAVILFGKECTQSFRYLRKQFMQLPSKTRFLGAQFKAFLEDDYWRSLAEPPITLASKLRDALKPLHNVEVIQESEANSVFVKIPKAWNKPLKDVAFFYVWDEASNIVRWMFSFQHREEEVDRFIEAIQTLDTNYTPESLR